MQLSPEEIGRFTGLVYGLIRFGVNAGIQIARKNPNADPAELLPAAMRALDNVIAHKWTEAIVMAQIRGDLAVEQGDQA